MTRRSLTEAAQERQGVAEQHDDRPSDTNQERPEDAERPAEENQIDDYQSASQDASERRRFTQRMPEPLVDDIDTFADAHGMSRNAAINMLAKVGLREF